MDREFSLIPAARRFWRDEDASLSVELVLILPMLIWGFLTLITIYDVFKARSNALKANYAISDLLSRETNSLTGSYLNGVDDVFTYLTQGGDSTWVRITHVVCIADCGDNDERIINMEWSQATGGQAAYTQQTMDDNLEPIIPLLAAGQYAFVVETSVDYTPPFLPPVNLSYIDDRTGERKEITWGIMRENTFRDTVVTEPRFGPKLCWTGMDACP